ncbi:sulfite exporter TauE/SafE family protein [Mycoplana dimorpha]|uniref:Probable membrane transporter protein n=1 Tax=Mycoplana dimorpha TaxID=28320 RepID=A0A2T5B595_MYCDI|nr:hypothetical protein C7449_10550 [Mycoplana dimorpha]
MSYSLLSAVGSGGLVGFMLGLLGGGGSMLATPLLLYAVGVAQPHVAIGTGALAVSVNAFANFASHAIKGHVWWRCALVFSGLGVVGALLGSSLGKAFDGERLIFLFGLLMVVVGALMLKPRKAVAAKPAVGTFGLATALNYASSGLVDWVLAAEFIGGGVVGGVFGMLLATRLGAYKNVLNRLFAALIFTVAAYILYRSWGAFLPA